MADDVWQACESLREATDWLTSEGDLNQRFAGAVPYLRAFARILGGHLHLTAALADSTAGKREKLARFYIKRLMPEYIGLLSHAQSGAEDLYAISVEEMAS
jgi:acyl-CoA dehydrogenase